MAKYGPCPTEHRRAFYDRFLRMLARQHGKENETGEFSARLLREVDSLWLFLEKAGVSLTNDHVERILFERQTCRLHAKRTFPVLVEAIDCYLKKQNPDSA